MCFQPPGLVHFMEGLAYLALAIIILDTAAPEEVCRSVHLQLWHRVDTKHNINMEKNSSVAKLKETIVGLLISGLQMY